MNPLFIATACLGLVSTIVKTPMVVIEFIGEAREVENDLDAVALELCSLKSVLELLAKDARTSYQP